jgi:uncharacterized membrane protein YfcA
MKAQTILLTFAAVSTAVVVGCAAPDITAPQQQREQANLLGLPRLGTPRLIECPSSESFTASSLITPLGGLISVGGVTISVPAGALLTDALMTVTVPASQFVEVEISVEGSEHFLFQVPSVVTVSYARCSRFFLLPLSAWHIDTETKELLELMPSVDNKLLRTVTFTTEHLSSFALSGYAVANAEQ